MKNFLRIVLVCGALLFAGTKSEAQSLPPYPQVLTHSGDTITNATSDSLYYSLQYYYTVANFQVDYTKISGNPAGVVAKIYGSNSLDVNMASKGWTLVATDSLLVANVATKQTHNWNAGPTIWQWYMIVVNGVASSQGKINAVVKYSNPPYSAFAQ